MERTKAEKKRLIWTLVAILFFFANLTVVTILIIQSLSSSTPAASRPATQPITTTSHPAAR